MASRRKYGSHVNRALRAQVSTWSVYKKQQSHFRIHASLHILSRAAPTSRFTRRPQIAPSMSTMEKPKAFLFDVFGTVVNCQDSLTTDLAAAAASAVEAHAQRGNDGLAAVARARGMVYADWEYFALQW